MLACLAVFLSAAWGLPDLPGALRLAQAGLPASSVGETGSSFLAVPHGSDSPHAPMIFYVTPRIENVQYPKKVRRGTPVKVKAKVYHPPDKTDFGQVAKVEARYVKGTRRGLVTLQARKGDVYEGMLPAFDEAGPLLFWLEAYDNAGNRTVELPATVTSFPPRGSELFLGIVDKQAPAGWVPEDIDLRELWVGFDAEHVYTKVVVQGEVQSARKEPLMIYAYAVPLLNLDEEGPLGLLAARLMLYAPRLRGLNIPPEGLFNIKMLLGGLDINNITADPIEVHRDKRGESNALYFRVKKELLGDNPCRCLQVGSLTIGATLTPQFNVAPWDASHYLLAYERTHWVEIR